MIKKKLIVFIILISFLSGCSFNKDYISQDFAEDEYYDYLISSEMTESFNYLVNNNEADTNVYANIIDGLVENDNYGRIIPALSQTTGQADDNYTRWTFYLREGMYWTNSEGESTEYSILADDFVFAIEYILDPAHESKYVSLITSTIQGAKEYYLAMKNGQSPDFSMVGVKAVSDTVIEYTLISSNSYFNSYLTSAAFYPLSREFYMSLEEGSFASGMDTILYSGAYHINSISSSKIVLNNNPFYWDSESSIFSKVTYRIVEDESEAADLFKKGKLSRVYLSSDIANDELSDYEDYMYTSSATNTSYVLLMNFESDNTNYKTAINNPNFRKALLYGFDRASALSTTTTTYLSSNTSIIPEYYIMDSKNTDYTRIGSIGSLSRNSLYSESEASSYLSKAKEELGDSVSFPITIRVPISSNNEMEQNLIDTLNDAYSKALGSSVIEFIATDYAGADEIAEGVTITNSYDMILTGIDVNGRDPYEYLGNFAKDGNLNSSFAHIDDDIFYSFLEEANSYSDIDDRYYALNECEAYLINGAFIIPYSSGRQVYTMSMINDYSRPVGYYGIAYKKMKGYEVIGKSISLSQLETYYEDYVKAAKGT